MRQMWKAESYLCSALTESGHVRKKSWVVCGRDYLAPQLKLLARAIITTISDLNQLQMLTIELSIASSQERAKELLLSLVSAA